MRKAAPKPEPVISTKQLVGVVGRTRQTIQQWKDEGMPYIKGKANLGDGFLVSEVLKWVSENKDQDKPQKETSELDQEKLLAAKADRILKEIKVRTISGKLIKRKKAEEELNILATRFKAKFEVLGDGLPLDRPSQAIVNDAIRKALGEFVGAMRKIPKKIAIQQAEDHVEKLTGESATTHNE